MVNSFSAALRKRPLDIPKGGAFVVKRRKKAERYKLFLIEGFLDKYFERFWNRFLKNFSRIDKNPALKPPLSRGIESLSHDARSHAVYYDANGIRLQHPRRGLNLVRMDDGTVRKVMVR